MKQNEAMLRNYVYTRCQHNWIMNIKIACEKEISKKIDLIEDSISCWRYIMACQETGKLSC